MMQVFIPDKGFDLLVDLILILFCHGGYLLISFSSFFIPVLMLARVRFMRAFLATEVVFLAPLLLVVLPLLVPVLRVRVRLVAVFLRFRVLFMAYVVFE